MGEKTDKVRFGLTGGTIRTEILGSQRLILEGCDGIVEYGRGTDRLPVRAAAGVGPRKNLRLVRVEGGQRRAVREDRGGGVPVTEKIARWVFGTATGARFRRYGALCERDGPKRHHAAQDRP